MNDKINELARQMLEEWDRQRANAPTSPEQAAPPTSQEQQALPVSAPPKVFVADCPKCGKHWERDDAYLDRDYKCDCGTSVRYRKAGVSSGDIRVEGWWSQVPNSEKWKVTWGVFGRILVIQVAASGGIFLLAVCAAAAAGR